MTAPLLCPAGHLALSPDARFCSRCGLPLSPSADLAAPAPAVRFDGPSCAVHPSAPALGPCPRCGTFACAACLVQLPDGSGICQACSARALLALPWDRREELGTVRAWWQTVLQIVSKPVVTFASAAPSAPIGSSLWFGVLAVAVGGAGTVGLYLVFGGALAMAAAARGGAGGSAGIVAVTLAAFAGMAVIGVGLGFAGMLISASVDHLILRIIRARPRGFLVTLRGSALSLAPAPVALIPLCGAYAWIAWTLVLRVFAYRSFHRISGWSAAIAALAAPIVLFVIVVGGYLALVAMAGLGALK